MDVLCMGMYRSGSTWQYNIISDLIGKQANSRSLGVVSGKQYAELPRLAAGEGWRCLKDHYGHPSFTKALAEGRALAVYSYRDLRDVAYSLVHKFNTSFTDIIETRKLLAYCLEQDAYWRSQPRTLILRYEDAMSNPVGTIRAIAAHLGIELAPGEAEKLAEENSLQSNRQRTDKLANQLRDKGLNLDNPTNALLYDDKSLLHWNHIREGRVGGWHTEAMPEEIFRLARECGDWLVENGYEQDEWWREMARMDRELRQADDRLAAAQDEQAMLRWKLARAEWDAAVLHERLDSSVYFLPYRIVRSLKRLVSSHSRAA